MKSMEERDHESRPAAGSPREGTPPFSATDGRRWSRRKVLTLGASGLAAVIAAGVAGTELVAHGVLPGQQELDRLDGACSVTSPPSRFSTLGASVSDQFYSRSRRRAVGYTVAWPPGHQLGDPLPLVVMLHGEGGNHRNALAGMSPAQAVALHVGGSPLLPMALVTVDGGVGYWNSHPGDDPLTMVVDELIPLCQSMHLGRPPSRIGMMGISMGGYGALLIAEKRPELVAAVAAISPAVWTSYSQASAANPAAYANAADFDADDVVTHAAALAGKPVRIASGIDDPFHPGVVALGRVLPASATVEFSGGCHTGDFFVAQEPPSLGFLAQHL
jgi:pimeloyl-ACP methyl ester carboxylesterase